MAPPSATVTETQTYKPSNGFDSPAAQPEEVQTHEPNPSSENHKGALQMKFPSPPKFEDKYEEREYLKGRLALAFRIFGKLGYDEGVAGHITLRVSGFSTTHRAKHLRCRTSL